MNIEKIKLQQITINEDNPREITEEKLEKLIESILILPKMMELRPIVVNAGMYILGGNMRCMALNQIQQMDLDSLEQKLQTCNGWQFKTQAEKDILLDFWGKWKDEPFAYIVNAESLTEAEQREFIIKDNIGFGTWDFDKLANEWDEKMLEDWGMDVWQLSKNDGSESNNLGNLDDFFNTDNRTKEDKTKVLICPHCGKNVYEIDETEEDE